MKLPTVVAACLSFLAHGVASESATTSRLTLPVNFKPPQVFKNTNAVHLISLEKSYAKETVNVVIENISPKPQQEYYVPFTSNRLAHVGGFEVKDKKDDALVGFEVEAVEFDPTSDVQYFRIRLPVPLASKAQQTLGISYYVLDSLKPMPASIGQADKQYLAYDFSAYYHSAYPTLKQKTEVKLPGSDAPDFTKVSAGAKEFPTKQGSKLTYGPFETEIPAGVISPSRVRYEFTHPVVYFAELERDIEVSHWGGNVAFEERYTMYNHGANLTTLFNRVKWAQSQYFNPQTFALKEMKFPLRVGSEDAYFTDVIGNVSTSRFRSSLREAVLEIKPRYPVFGGWKYPFTVGWNAAAKNFLKRASGDTYVLNVPFLEGPKLGEGAQYETTTVRVLLPEGAEKVKYFAKIPSDSITSAVIDVQKTYLDTVGRTVVTIKSRNLVDDMRGRDLVISYDYSFLASLRKPLVIFASTLSVFVGVWAISQVDVKFSTK
ncbi:Ribophorin I [Microdochium trichocladiopsis]|uniref:Dolichyl-diphosphooligosaccharide--protein glycosyltransferase subunit 1 n=1 Tax=Microdochium trichocladiopsis TaxID=1682393 RepID=A0A9P8YB58_9PEZI|nr:Ribophorin I [Microdochium trichocladiopsis]KAH7034824.1 Ribophorin I [Microdochium trichocladiopsis]